MFSAKQKVTFGKAISSKLVFWFIIVCFMKIFYDKEVDVAYIELSTDKLEGVVEIKEGVHLDITADDRIVGIEFLDTSQKISLSSLFEYQLAEDLVHI